jgi:1-acyl-sn-glycerol-3-phosphate acyltransferase
MNYLLQPVRVIYKTWFFLCFALSLVLFYPVFKYYLSSQKRWPKAFVIMRFYAHLLHALAFIRLKVDGEENIPANGSFIICPNHTSFIDITCIYIIFKRYFVFTGKKEIEKWPLFHIFYTSGMNILVDRKSRSGAFRAFKRMAEEIDNGNPIMIFPEGTISKQAPKLTSFKSGAFAMAIQKQIPILPVTFVTNWKRLQRSKFYAGKASPGLSEIVIHQPIITAGLTKSDADSLESRVRAIINGPLEKRYGSLVFDTTSLQGAP